MHYSQQLTLQHLTKILFFFKVNLSLSSKFQPPLMGSTRPHLNLIINWLLDANADRKLPNLCTVNEWTLPKLNVRYKFKKTKKSINLDSRFVDLENSGFPATLRQPFVSFSSCSAISHAYQRQLLLSGIAVVRFTWACTSEEDLWTAPLETFTKRGCFWAHVWCKMLEFLFQSYLHVMLLEAIEPSCPKYGLFIEVYHRSIA